MKKHCILFAMALALIFCFPTGCQEKDKGGSTGPAPDTVTEAVGDPAPDSGSDTESAPAPELPSEPGGNGSGKKPAGKYTLDVAIEGEDF